MNRSFTKNPNFYSNRRIFEGECRESARPIPSGKRFLFLLYRAIVALCLFVTSAKVRRAFPAVWTMICLVGLMGVAGSIEMGNLSIGGGLLISAFLLGTELLCLCRH